VQDLYNLKHMELTSAIWIDPLKLLQPWPEEQNRLEVTIRPFQPTVCIIIPIIFKIYFFTLSQHL